MTSSHGNIFRVTGRLRGEFTGHRWIPRTKASDAKLWCFFDLRLDKRLSKQSRGWWFETPSCPLWPHRNERTHILKSILNIFVPLRYCWPNTVLYEELQCFGFISLSYNMLGVGFLLNCRAAILGVQSCTTEYDVIFVYCGLILWFVLLTQTLFAYLRITHWGREKMAAIVADDTLNAFSWMKMFEFRLKCHWGLFSRLRLTMFQHWIR